MICKPGNLLSAWGETSEESSVPVIRNLWNARCGTVQAAGAYKNLEQQSLMRRDGIRCITFCNIPQNLIFKIRRMLFFRRTLCTLNQPLWGSGLHFYLPWQNSVFSISDDSCGQNLQLPQNTEWEKTGFCRGRYFIFKNMLFKKPFKKRLRLEMLESRKTFLSFRERAI